MLTDGEIGLGESYMDGDWSTPDLVGLIRLMYANSHVVSAPPAFATWPARLRDQIAHRRRDNSRNGSRSNIHAHYDLGNEFFRLFLDANLLYSCALYERADDSLEAAQVNKLRTICEKLDLRPGDHVLEIGSGWGGFAMFAATRYGCRVTTTTISAGTACVFAPSSSRAAARLARESICVSRIIAICAARYDKIVSIEMFEAVGLRHYDDYFGCLRSAAGAGRRDAAADDHGGRLAVHGLSRTPSWIAKYIFPGAELASVAEILQSLARVSRLSLFHHGADRHALRAHAARVARAVSCTAGRGARARLRRALHPHVGSVSRLL